jgi:transcription elongation GreA/GreB family factor
VSVEYLVTREKPDNSEVIESIRNHLKNIENEECKAELRRRKVQNNPVALNRKLNEAVEKLLKVHRETGYPGNIPCQGGSQVPAA